MPISCDVARKMLAEALASRASVRSLSQILVALYGLIGKEETDRLVGQIDNPSLGEAVRIAKGLIESEESSWEVPVVRLPVGKPPQRKPGALAQRIKERHG